jgi:hypothetical protein
VGCIGILNMVSHLAAMRRRSPYRTRASEASAIMSQPLETGRGNPTVGGRRSLRGRLRHRLPTAARHTTGRRGGRSLNFAAPAGATRRVIDRMLPLDPDEAPHAEDALSADLPADAPRPQAPRRRGAEVEALMTRLEDRKPIPDEGQDLARMLRHRIAHMLPDGDEDEQVVDELEVRSRFLAHRFTEPVTAYERWDGIYRAFDDILNWLSISAGVAISLTVSLSAPKWLPISLGVLVTLLQAVSQWQKPAQAAARFGRAATDLREEAWAFLQGQGRYHRLGSERAWEQFCQQITTIEDKQESDEDHDQEGIAARVGGVVGRLRGH